MSVRFWRSAGHFGASISREICTVPSLYRPSTATDGVINELKYIECCSYRRLREYIKWRCISPGENAYAHAHFSNERVIALCRAQGAGFG